MTKCGSLNDAVDHLLEVLEGMNLSQSVNEKQRIIRTAIKECLADLNPDYTEEFYEEVDGAVDAFPEAASALYGWREILNPEYIEDNREAGRSKVDDEETDVDLLINRARVRREFLNAQFKDADSKTTAGRALLYFLRDSNQKLMKTFLIDRNAGTLVAKEDIPQRVLEFKQQLLDTIVEYLSSVGYKGTPKLFDQTGVYLDPMNSDKTLKTAIDTFLTIGSSFDTLYLKTAYEEFRSETGNWEKSKKFLEAYNAKVLLTNFDSVTKMLLGSIVKPGQTHFNSISNVEYITSIHKATKMWGNGFGDEVENIADIVSEITLRLVRTSLKYSWKGGPMKDQYLSFQEFNHIITKIKRLHQEPTSKQIVFNNTFWDAKGNDYNSISNDTKRSLDTIKELKKEQGYSDTAPTFEDLLSFISDNPQRHLHAIFDLLCNTDIVNRFPKIDSLDKNLIWTVGKELFGSWTNEVDSEGNPTTSRSLYDMHKNSDNDRIFEIITLAADSIFLDLFLQYYEDLEGTLKIRVLQDYALSQVKNQIMYDMRLTHGMFNPDRFNKFLSENKIQLDYKDASTIAPINNIGRVWTIANPDYNPDLPGSRPKLRQKALFLKKVTIPVGNLMKIEFEDGKLKRFSKSNVFTNNYEAIWKSDAFRQIVKDTIGKDFKTDVELASAYEETFKQPGLSGGIEISYKNLVTDLSLLCGAVVFNLAFNNVVVPTILSNGARERNKRNVEILRDNQYYGQAAPRINPETGVVEMLADNVKESYLSNLGLALATVHGLLTSALVKTAQNTAVAAQCLSRLQSSYSYQFMVQNKHKNSATRHLTIVNNENGMFRDPVSRREFKSDATVKVNTDTSAIESYQLSFLGITGAFIDAQDATTLNRNGQAYIVPEVSSDKSNQAELPVQLKAESRWLKGKSLSTMSVAELEKEMCFEFGTMYDTIIKNINKENLRLAELFNIDTTLFKGRPAVVNYVNILSTITDTICNPTTLVLLYEEKNTTNAENVKILRDLGKLYPDILKALEEEHADEIASIRQKHLVKLMHEATVDYNRFHRRAPIQIAEQIHFLFNKQGRLVPNDTLRALWGRFQGNEALNKQYGITELYPKSREYANTVEGYFRMKDLRGVEELYTNGFELFLLGARSKAKLAEIQYLRELFPDWMTRSGKMALARVYISGTYRIIENLEDFKKYAYDPATRNNILIHPMISKINRITYLVNQQYTCSVGGAHYVYKGKGSNVLEEEANRWLASNKRNVCYASTVHKYQNKTLTGPPKVYQIAPIEDIKSVIYSIMGDMDSHKPIDGGMFVLPWLAELENNALGGEAAGVDKKQFGTYYYADIAAGGIIKTAGFALTNQRMLRSEAYRNLCKNMTDRIWIKEYAAADGSDIEEYLDITRDWKGNTINWILDDTGKRTYYQRSTANGGCLRYSLANIEAIYTNGAEERTFQGPVPMGWTPTNKYKIYEYPVTKNGEVDSKHPGIASQLTDSSKNDISPILKRDKDHPDGIYTIHSNWDLYTQVFGGYNSLSLDNDGILRPSEHSISLMVYALNNIGYKRDIEHNDSKFGDKKYISEEIEKVETQDDLWLPLKYSDIQYAPNIGALKSTLMNVNPSEGMYAETYLNAMNIMMALLGIQLDKEHHADDSEVSMPTQIIQACSNKGYTIEYSSQLYKSLSTLTELAIEDCMKGVMELMPGNENKGTLLTEIANIIVNKLIHSLDDNVALDAVFEHLIKKAQDGKKLTSEDLAENPIPWSDAKLYNKVYNDIASHLTTNAIKMKFPGTLAVICPTERVERMYGNRRLNLFVDPDANISEELGKSMYLDSVRSGREKGLIYDAEKHSNDIYEKLSLASNIDTQHHYWVEYSYADGSPVVDELGNIYKENYTIESPKDYFKIRELIAYGGEGNINLKTMAGEPISREDIRVSKVYENVMEGRELGAYNVRFRTTEANQQFNIFDLSSVLFLFDFNDLDKTMENVNELLENDKFIDRGYAVIKILEYMYKKTPESAKLLEGAMKARPDLDITLAAAAINEEVTNDFINSAFAICKGIVYKLFEQDLFKISPDYKGDRRVYINNSLMTVNPDTILTLAYELIMPKVYLTKFGLLEQDLVLEILADKNFFTKRALSRVAELKVDPSCFHYELKNFNGKHVYIWDTNLGQPDPELFQNKIFYPIETATGKYERRDIDGNFMHELSSKEDKIMKVGDLGYEVIVTGDPAFYLEHLNYNIPAFSNETVKEESLLDLVDLLALSDSKKAKLFVNTFTTKKGELRKFKNLQNRNDAFKTLSLDEEEGESADITYLRKRFIKEGNELWTSFDKSLDVIAGRIPAQSQQSFMPQRVVAFDNNDVNTAYVSTFQLFLQGSKTNYTNVK